mmetsp:Transcript_53884/g.157183  ORF Transcript_53884/g.157183 Transcript_53884/m.157183 type:complete len:288 (-) Transcript_53884:396-1259(-)
MHVHKELGIHVQAARARAPAASRGPAAAQQQCALGGLRPQTASTSHRPLHLQQDQLPSREAQARKSGELAQPSGPPQASEATASEWWSTLKHRSRRSRSNTSSSPSMQPAARKVPCGLTARLRAVACGEPSMDLRSRRGSSPQVLTSQEATLPSSEPAARRCAPAWQARHRTAAAPSMQRSCRGWRMSHARTLPSRPAAARTKERGAPRKRQQARGAPEQPSSRTRRWPCWSQSRARPSSPALASMPSSPCTSRPATRAPWPQDASRRRRSPLGFQSWTSRPTAKAR